MNKYTKICIILSILLFIFSVINIGAAFARNNILKITNVEVTEKSQDVNVDILGHTDDTISSNTTYHHLNDYVVYKVTIKNTDNKKHIVDLVLDNNAKDYLTYDYDDYKNTIIESNQEVDIYIKEVYKSAVTDKNQRVQSNKVSFTFNLIGEEKNERVKGAEVIVKKGIGFFIYVFLAIITFIIIFLLIPKKEDKDKKKARVLLIALFLISLLSVGIPTISSALETNDSILFDSAIALYDKMSITYDVDGNKESVSVNYGKPAKEPLSPTKDGYEFIGWYYNGKKYDFDRDITNDIYLTAMFKKTTFSVSYNYNGGNVNNPSSFVIDELPITLKEPYKEGYTFIGWTGSNGNDPQKDIVITSATSDLNYKANYVANEYKIEYYGITDNEYSSLNNPEKYTIENKITLKNPSNRLDTAGEIAHKFIGWRDSDGNISKTISLKNATGDKTYEAIWQKIKPDTHTITYVLNGGTITGEQNPTEFDSNTETFTLNNPTKYGYTFDGWIGSNGNTPQTTVTVQKGTASNLNFEAIFSINHYQISYDLDDGVATNPTSYTVNDQITLNNPTKEGYEFKGWTGTGLSELTMNVTIPLNSIDDRSYTANFEIINYDINYVLHGGDVEGNQDTYNINDEFTLNNPTKVGYTFEGWIGSNGNTPQTTVTISYETGDKNYEAVFTANTYKVHFNKNNDNATGIMNDQTITYDEDTYLTANRFEYDGYIFEGWTTNPDGTGTSYADGALVRNLLTTGTIELFAKWRKATIATFASGSTVNTRMKRLTGQDGAGTGTKNTSILKVKYSTDIPDGLTGNSIVSANNSTPIYMWFENGIIYYGSTAELLYLGSDASFMFANLDQVTEIDTKFKTTNTTKMTQMFFADHSLTTLDVSHFKTDKVTEMTSMFGENTSLPSINVNSWDVRKVTIFNFMFNQCTQIVTLDLSNWHTDSATSFRNMFSSMESLESIDISNFYTAKVSNFRAMFDNQYKNKRLELSNFDTSSGTNFEQFVRNNYELTYIDLSTFNTSQVTNMNAMFQNDRNLETLDVSTFNTKKVTTMNNMFSGMSKVTTIYASADFDLPKMTSNPIVFQDDVLLVGGAGTAYNASQVKKTYAHIDGGTANPGYFTAK